MMQTVRKLSILPTMVVAVFVSLLFISGNAWGQTQIFVEDFEDATITYSPSVSEFTDGSGDYFIRTDETNIGSSFSVSNIQDSYYFGAQDLDGEGATLPLFLNFDDIGITGYSTLTFKVYLAEDDDGTSQDWDAADYVHFSYDIDNSGTYTDLLWIEASGSSNSEPLIDTDFDGTGDGTAITDEFTQYSVSIPSTGSDLDIQIEFNLNSGDEDIAIDHIEVYGTMVSSGPSITNISHAPVSPASSDAVSVSADITDSDGIFGAEIHWGTTSGSLTNTINMSVNSGDTYVTDTDIPAQSAGTTVYYEVYALDNNSDETTSTEQTYTVACPSVSDPVAIAASSVAGTSFTANWNSVSGATGYKLDVYSSGGVGSELVVNGGFESGDNAGWTTFESEYQIIANDGAVTPHSGSYMLKCFASGTRDLAQNITISADGSTTYEVSFWYRYESVSDPEKLRIWSDFTLGYSGDDLEPGTYLDATDTWTQVTYSVTPSAGSNTLNLELRSYSSGKIYLDDISFRQSGGGTTYHLQNENVGNVTSYGVSGLTAGETYYYVVRAYNDCGSESGDSNEITVNLSCSDPTTQASVLSFPDTQYDQMDIAWTNGDGDYRLVVVSTSAITGTPSDNTTYSADANFGDGDVLNAGEFIVYAGNGSSVTMTGLNSDAEYFIKVFEYNCDGGSEQYLTSSPLSGSETTVANIPAVTDFDVVCTTETTATVEWTNPASGDWDGVIIAIRNSTLAVHTLSDDPSSVTADVIFGSGHEFGTTTPNSYVVYKGSGTSMTISGLTQGQDYTLKAFSYYGSLIGDETTTTISQLEISEVTAASATTENSQTNLSWSNPGACYDEILVVGHDGSAVTSTPSGDGTSYTDDGYFGNGTDIGTNEFVVYQGTSTSVTVTNLTNGNAYYFTVFVRVGTEWSSGVQVVATPSEVTDFIPGDLAIIAVNTDYQGHATLGDFEEFTFIAFKSINVGTSIDFTENGWERAVADRWGTTEGAIRLTREAGGNLPAGTSVTVVMNGVNGIDDTHFDIYVNGIDELAAGIWSISELNPTKGAGFNLNSEDDIWIMQGGSWIEHDNSSSPTYHDDEYTGYVLYGWTATGWPGGDSPGTTEFSNLYPACECFNTNVSGLANHSKVKYTGPMTDATKLEWIMRFNDETNWTGYVDDASYDAGAPDYRDSGVIIGILPGGFESGRWTADQNTDWFDCGNWQNLTIPDENTDVVISSSYASDDAVVNSSENAICHDITIESGRGLDFSSNTLEVHGDFLNQSASVITTDGTLLLASSEDSEITSNGTVMNNVTVNGSGSFMLQDNLSLTGALTLTDGVLATGTNLLHVDNTNVNAITGYTSASYINGNLRRSVTGVGIYDFPVGDASNFELGSVEVSSATALTYLDAHFASADLGDVNIAPLGLQIDGTPLVAALDAGYWQIEPNSGATVNYNIELNLSGAANAAPLAEQHAVIKRDDAVSDWELQGSHDNSIQSISGGVVTAKLSNLSAFSQFAIARSNQWVLAVELIDFNVQCETAGLMIGWTTASEENSDYFEIQYSSDAKSWTKIQKLPAFGTTNMRQEYQLLLEESPRVGYYRLAEIDMDGTRTVYEAEYVNCLSENEGVEIVLAPNPAADFAEVRALKTSADFYLVGIFDARGKVINILSWENPAEQPLVLNLNEFASGVYSIRVYNESENHSCKLLVK